MDIKQFQASQALAPKLSAAIPDETERGVVYGALAILMASQFVHDTMTDDEIEKYMENFAKFVCLVVSARRMFEKELN